MTASRTIGFTLLELCLALAIGVMIILLTVPSIAGLIAEQRLKRSFERFDHLVARAHVRSVTEQRAYALIWEREGIVVRPVGMSAGESTSIPDERLLFAKGESFQLQRTAALTEKPASEWVFWRNGLCEPVDVAFQGPSGSWVVRYNALTGQGTFLTSSVP